MSELFKDESISDKKKSFCIHVLSDAFISAAERWLTDKEKLTAVEFCEYLHFIFDKYPLFYIQVAGPFYWGIYDTNTSYWPSRRPSSPKDWA